MYDNKYMLVDLLKTKQLFLTWNLFVVFLRVLLWSRDRNTASVPGSEEWNKSKIITLKKMITLTVNTIKCKSHFWTADFVSAASRYNETSVKHPHDMWQWWFSVMVFRSKCWRKLADSDWMPQSSAAAQQRTLHDYRTSSASPQTSRAGFLSTRCRQPQHNGLINTRVNSTHRT